MREALNMDDFKTPKGIYEGKDKPGEGHTGYFGADAQAVGGEGEALAKSVPHETGTTYFARFDDKHFFNPLTHNGAKLDTYDTMRGRLKYPMLRVSKDKFDAYLEFLRTKNAARLSILERM